jgi:uncharacterized protein
MGNLVGRIAEIDLLQKIEKGNKAEFVAVFGRRRVGKTYLIKQLFQEKFAFYLTGIANVNTSMQLGNFITAYKTYANNEAAVMPQTWFEAFDLLKPLVEAKGKKTCIIFLDELPWLDTPRSNFIQALEHFWNSYGSAKNNLKLITCGSAASWMINKLINNHGGLHNRVTNRLHIQPFTLWETEQLLLAKNIYLERYQIVELYAVLGGIPFYIDAVEKGLSIAQNIDKLCFTNTGLLRNEYQNLFKSLFKDAEKHEQVITALATKTKGLLRSEIINTANIPNGGNTSKLLEELEYSGFIRKYLPFKGKQRNSLYQLTDPFVLFYNQFMQNAKAQGDGVWLSLIGSAKHKTWSGYAFENVSLLHINEIKKALGISGIYSENSSWRSIGKTENAQIDLLIDRKDNAISVCEMKFANEEFIITKEYAEKLKQKLRVFKTETKTKKTLLPTLITTYGAQKNSHYLGIIQNELTLNDLFIK